MIAITPSEGPSSEIALNHTRRRQVAFFVRRHKRLRLLLLSFIRELLVRWLQRSGNSLAFAFLRLQSPDHCGRYCKLGEKDSLRTVATIQFVAIHLDGIAVTLTVVFPRHHFHHYHKVSRRLVPTYTTVDADSTKETETQVPS